MRTIEKKQRDTNVFKTQLENTSLALSTETRTETLSTSLQLLLVAYNNSSKVIY